MKKLILLILTVSINVLGQIDSSSSYQEVINHLIENYSEQENSINLWNYYDSFYENRIDLNSADKEELQKLLFLSSREISKIIENTPYDKKTELIENKLISNESYYLLRYFVKISKSKVLENISDYFKDGSVHFRSRISKKLQEQKAYRNNKFYGSSEKYYSRLKYNNNLFGFSLLTEKDPGEDSFNDFNSYSLRINNVSIIKKLVLGDYLVEFGEGLTSWGPYSFSKGNDAVNNVFKRPRGIIQYTSSDENRFNRGAALQLNAHYADISFYYSNNKIDASYDNNLCCITSLPRDGYHRTSTELDKKDFLTEKSFGAIINYSFWEGFKFNYFFASKEYSQNIRINNTLDITGNSFIYHSFHTQYYSESFQFGGEITASEKQIPFIMNFAFIPIRNLEFAFSVRDYPNEYFNIHANGFSETSSATQNERGYYLGMRYKLIGYKINLSFDSYRFPNSTYFYLFPTSGREINFNIRKDISENISGFFRYKNEKRQNEKLDEIKQNFRLEAVFLTAEKIRLKSRIDIIHYSDDFSHLDEFGYLFYQDIRLNVLKNLRIYGRFTIFSTESYNSRVYEYENDLRGIMRNSVLFGEGIKWYFLINYKLFDYLSFSVKYSEILKPDEKTLGSGDYEIFSNMDNYLNFQVNLRY